jgi:hypothetical protein
MNWYYESAGQQQGPVNETELDRLLAEGKITLDTLIWREGMTGWTPLRAARPTAPAPAAPVAPGTEIPSAVSAAPSPTSGSDVPQPGWVRCSLTGRYFPPSEIIYIEGKPYCAAAKPQVVAAMQSGGILPISGLAGERTGPAWEQRETLGTWKALVETVKGVLSQPAQTFANMRQSGGIGGPLIFWLLTGGVGMIVSQLSGVLMQGAIMSGAAASGNAAARQQVWASMGLTGATGLVFAVLSPLIGLVSLFIMSGLVHLALMMLKGANQPFETTFRTLAYAYGGTGVISLIPMCGASVAGIWGLIALCIGLGPAHGTTTGKGVAATLLPIGVCCLAVIGFYAAIFGVIAASAGSHHP